MRRPRFRLRTLMIAVTIVGVVLGGSIATWRLGREARRRKSAAASHAQRASTYARLAEVYQLKVTLGATEAGRSQLFLPPPTGVDEASHREWRCAQLTLYQKSAESTRRRALYNASLSRKYAEAAGRPWEALAPDPPEPD